MTPVEVNVERAEGGDEGGRRHPNTCPGCRSHYRDDELRREAVEALVGAEATATFFPVDAPIQEPIIPVPGRLTPRFLDVAFPAPVTRARVTIVRPERRVERITIARRGVTSTVAAVPAPTSLSRTAIIGRQKPSAFAPRSRASRQRWMISKNWARTARRRPGLAISRTLP